MFYELKGPMECVFAVLLLASAVACQHAAPTRSLYEDLGSAEGIDRLVVAFIDRLAADPLVVDSFADTDMQAFHGHLSDQLCLLSGGGCRYEGRSMTEAHRGLGIDARQFNATVADLMKAMDDVELPQGVQNRLLKLLAPMYGDMVDIDGDGPEHRELASRRP